jgi:hypothetical protein
VDGVDGMEHLHCDGGEPMLGVKDFFSHNLIHTFVVDVDNFLKCVHDELEKIVYIHEPVAYVEDDSNLQLHIFEDGEFVELEGLEGLEDRPLELRLGLGGRIVKMQPSHGGNFCSLLHTWSAFDDDVETLCLLWLTLVSRHQDGNGVGDERLIVGDSGGHDGYVAFGSCWSGYMRTEPSMK